MPESISSRADGYRHCERQRGNLPIIRDLTKNRLQSFFMRTITACFLQRNVSFSKNYVTFLGSH